MIGLKKRNVKKKSIKIIKNIKISLADIRNNILSNENFNILKNKNYLWIR